jgi:hypothetical protein
MHREKARTTAVPLEKDPAKMTDAELKAAMADMRTQCATALFDTKHPMHHEALRFLPEILRSAAFPDTYADDASAITA